MLRVGAVLLALCVGVRGGEPSSSVQRFDCNRVGFSLTWLSRSRALVRCADETSARLYETYNNGEQWQAIKPDSCDDPTCLRDMYQVDDSHAVLNTISGPVVWEDDVDAKSSVTIPVRLGGAKRFESRIKVSPHPQQPGVAVGTVKDSSCSHESHCHVDVYITKNYGKEWSKLPIEAGRRVYYVRWGNPNGEQYHPSYLFMVVARGGSGYYDAAFKYAEAYHTEDGTARTVLDDAFFFLPVGTFTYFLVAHDHSQVSLYVSSNNGEQAKRAIFPSDDKEEMYTVVSVAMGVAFVSVYHKPCTGSKVAWGQLYQSGISGEHFTLSLANIRWSHVKNGPDFHAVGSIVGVFMSNVAVLNQDSAEDNACWRCATEEDCRKYCRFETRVSRENGDAMTWKKLHVPELCQNPDSDDCFLHLHDMASEQEWLPELKSSPLAPGMVLGVGNVGKSLDIEADMADVFLSLDAGESWTRVLNEPHFFDFGNYGGLIVAAPSRRPTDYLTYSFDMGKTWVNYTFSHFEVWVHGVEAEGGKRHPNPQSAAFIVTATAADAAANYVFSVSLRDVKGPMVDCVMDDDFDKSFSLKGTNEPCFLGAKTTYYRRKPDSVCWNSQRPSVMENSHSVEACDCTLEDYGCAVGFVYSWADRECHSAITHERVWDMTKGEFIEDTDSHEPRFCLEETYMRTKGYALKPGFSCHPTKDLNLLPVAVKCPVEKQINGGGGGLGPFGTFVVVIFVLMLVGFAAIYVFAHVFENPTAIALKIIIEDSCKTCFDCCKGMTNKGMMYSERADIEVMSNDDLDDDREEVPYSHDTSPGAAVDVPVEAPVVVETAPAPVPEEASAAAPVNTNDDEFGGLHEDANTAVETAPNTQGGTSVNVDDLF